MTVTAHYHYDGRHVLTETDHADTPQRDYAYGNYLDEARFMVADPTDTATTYYLAHDHHLSRASCPRYQPPAPLGDNRIVLNKKQIPPVALLESGNGSYHPLLTSTGDKK